MDQIDPPEPADRPEASPPPQAPRGGTWVKEIVLIVVIAMTLAVGVKTFVAQAFYIPSGSMLSQLQVGDRVVVSKLSYRLHEPRRGDIVVFDNPNPQPTPSENLPTRLFRELREAVGVSAPSTDEFIKRVIGLPGEEVQGREGKVFIDGRQVVEPYLISGTSTSDFGPVTVGAGELWVMGDNRSRSADSRVFGTIDQSTVVGRAVVRVWPIPTLSFL